MENNSRPICPKDGKSLFWLNEGPGEGRLFCICGFSEWFFKRSPDLSRQEYKDIWGKTDGRFGNPNHIGGHKRHLRTFNCIICGKTVTREAYVKENLCGSEECWKKRQLAYTKKSQDKKGIVTRHGMVVDVMDDFGKEGTI